MTYGLEIIMQCGTIVHAQQNVLYVVSLGMELIDLMSEPHMSNFTYISCARSFCPRHTNDPDLTANRWGLYPLCQPLVGSPAISRFVNDRCSPRDCRSLCSFNISFWLYRGRITVKVMNSMTNDRPVCKSPFRPKPESWKADSSENT